MENGAYMSESELQRRMLLLKDMEMRHLPFDMGEVLSVLGDAIQEDLSHLERKNLEDTLYELIAIRNARKEDRSRPNELREAEIKVLNKVISGFQKMGDEDISEITGEESLGEDKEI